MRAMDLVFGVKFGDSAACGQRKGYIWVDESTPPVHVDIKLSCLERFQPNEMINRFHAISIPRHVNDMMTSVPGRSRAYASCAGPNRMSL